MGGQITQLPTGSYVVRVAGRILVLTEVEMERARERGEVYRAHEDHERAARVEAWKTLSAKNEEPQ